MDDYRGLWVIWARSNYREPAAANAAVDAAMAAIEKGWAPSAAAIDGHRAAVQAGGEYRCRPNRTAKAIVVCVLVAAMFIPATLIGLSANPAPAGYVFLAVMGGGPFLAVVGLALVRVNSCFFVTRDTVGRRNLLGRVASSGHRAGLNGVKLRSGSWTEALITEAPDDSEVQFEMPDSSGSRTRLYWWTDDRITEFAAVAGASMSTF